LATLAQEFAADAPDKAWVTDFTYIRTHEGWLYLAVVIDLFNSQVNFVEQSLDGPQSEIVTANDLESRDDDFIPF